MRNEKRHGPYVRTTELREARFAKFLQEFGKFESEQKVEEAQDRFLDAYSLWLRHRSPVTYENLAQAVHMLRTYDASFRFFLPSPGDTDDA